MKLNRQDSEEMYSPDDQGGYMPELGILSMNRWTAWAQLISSFMISRAAGDSRRVPLRLSKHMWQRHSPSGFPALLILLSSSSCWQKDWQSSMATSDRHYQSSQTEYPKATLLHKVSSESDSM